MTAAERIDRHWRANRRMVAWMLWVWFLVSFVGVFFARDLSVRLFGWPFGFWLAAQGALLVYLGLVWWYARLMDRLDHDCGLAEDD